MPKRILLILTFICFALQAACAETTPVEQDGVAPAEEEQVDAPEESGVEPDAEPQEPAPTDTNIPEPTATPIPTETPVPTEPPAILHQDDFSDVNSGWERYNEFDGVLDYHEGGYRMWVSTTDNLFWVNYGQEYQDIRIEADAVKIGGPDNNQFGLICRLEFNNYNHYAFIITSQGQYGIVEKVGVKDFQFLGADGLQSSEAINTGDQPNHIRGDCVGNTFTLYVNDVMLLQAQDDTIPQGDVGLAAGTFGEPGTDILFDNFVLIEP